MNGKFYIYEHWRSDTNVCFYVGKGSGDRVQKISRRNRHHKSIVEHLSRCGWFVEVRIVSHFLNEADALAAEVERIAFWRASGISLVNATDGGEGTSGFKHTDQSREKMSKARTGLPGRKTMLGKKLSEEAKKKISIASKGRVKTDEERANISRAKKGSKSPFKGLSRDRAVVEKIALSLRGRKLSEEHKKKLCEARKNRPPPSAETRVKLSAASMRRWDKRKAEAQS